MIDNLAYAYNVNSNKILKVDDISNETASFKDVTGNDYTYWEDGSLKSDNNKDISLIDYNYLKLPKRIVKGSTTILYQYDASGRKLRETIGTNVTDYAGNLIYKNNSLYQLSHDEGRIVNDVYEYNIKDHLGNLRVTFKDSLGVAKITQSNAYGVWGEDLPTLSYQNTVNLNNFKFTGKYEEIPTLGCYDFGNRLYDPTIVRWNALDRFADKYQNLSPYTAFGGNPLLFTDVNGDSLMMFKNGTYIGMFDNGKKEITGFNQESSVGKDGKETFTGGNSFEFNDIDLDKNKLKSGRMLLNFMSNKDVESVIASSGADQQGIFSRWVHASTESNAGNERGTGKMDMRGQVSHGTLNIINGVGYNNADTGNYFWGYAMRKMGYSEPLLYLSSNLNAWWSAKESNGQGSRNSNPMMRWLENRSWGGESQADQRAIFRGMSDAGSYWINKLKSLRR